MTRLKKNTIQAHYLLQVDALKKFYNTDKQNQLEMCSSICELCMTLENSEFYYCTAMELQQQKIPHTGDKESLDRCG